MKVEHTVFGDIYEENFRRISKYTVDKVNANKFRDPSKWFDLRDLLLYHPDPIVRHEASFVIGELGNTGLEPYLMTVIKFDNSIVAKHEAAEALGRMQGRDAYYAYKFLLKVYDNIKNYDDGV
ncbi:HEAT repeat domain-containing protein [Candidatus Woesearchaeota archaeon]|nr:HEAT repeat domain-containing protein [Candidatus Woesearchaeota archaeon]